MVVDPTRGLTRTVSVVFPYGTSPDVVSAVLTPYLPERRSYRQVLEFTPEMVEGINRNVGPKDRMEAQTCYSFVATSVQDALRISRELGTDSRVLRAEVAAERHAV